MSKAMQVLKAHVASTREFHKSMAENKTGLDAGSRAAHSAALGDCDKTLEMCKAVEDDLGKAAENQKVETAALVKAEVAEGLLKALGDQVVRGPSISRLAPAPPRAVPRFGAPEAKAVDVPVELQKVWGGRDEDQIEV